MEKNNDPVTLEVERVISPENMQKIAHRNSSNNSIILLICDYIIKLTENSDHSTFRKLTRMVNLLLDDEEPNRDWIHSLISELNCESTKQYYIELKHLIYDGVNQ